jgi:hypothetical protein
MLMPSAVPLEIQGLSQLWQTKTSNNSHQIKASPQFLHRFDPPQARSIQALFARSTCASNYF